MITPDTAVVQNYFYTVDRFFFSHNSSFSVCPKKSRFKKSATTRTATVYFRQQLTTKRVEIKFTYVFFRLSGGVSIYSATVCAYTLADGPDSFAKTRIRVHRGSFVREGPVRLRMQVEVCFRVQ